MDQNIQQAEQTQASVGQTAPPAQHKLPVKTKIAEWWMIILLILSLFVLIPTLLTSYIFYAIIILSVILVLFFSIFFLEKKKRLGWWLPVISMALFIIVGYIPIPILSGFYYGAFSTSRIVAVFLAAVPLILLLLDRKNFWKVAK